MANQKKTSKPVASLASEVLRDSNASETAKKLAGSALSQMNGNKETGKEMETFAYMVLKSEKYNEQTKKLAASVLTQSDKNR